MKSTENLRHVFCFFWAHPSFLFSHNIIFLKRHASTPHLYSVATSPLHTMSTPRKILIIGSGISGLAAARELKHRGYDVLVVEARGRVGGRLKGEPLLLKDGKHDVDLGGALIHGIEDNPVYKVTTQMGVPLHEVSDYCLLLNENGWPFDPKEDEKLSTLYNECLDEAFRRVEEDKTSKENFGVLFDRVCRERGVKNTHPLLKWHQANLELPTGADFHQLGYTWNDDEAYGFEGAHAAVEPSWNYIMSELADGLDIMYDAPVRKVQVVLPSGESPKSFLDTPAVPQLDEKDEEESDQSPVKILTRTEWRKAPKMKTSAKTPQRQSRRIRGDDATVRRSSRANKGVIQKLTIGHDTGVFSYDDPDAKPLTPRKKRKQPADSAGGCRIQVTLKNGKILEADAVVCTLPLGILKLSPTSPEHVQFAPPLPLAKQQAIQELGCGLLNKCAISFSHVFWPDSEFLGLAKNEHSYLVLNATKYTGKPILIFMYGGSFAKEVEAWTDSDIVEDCLDVLRRIVGKEIPQPVDYCTTRWGKEQYSRMSFTYIPPGVDGTAQLQAAGEAIYDPEMPGKPLIMFAGEHTTPYFPSTMHGAFLSGIREAYRFDMEFETNHMIYDFTFPVRRTYRGSTCITNRVKATSGASAAKKSEIRSRRRRFANMALRKDPSKRFSTEANKVQTETPQRSAPDAKTPDSVSRRSSRSVYVKKTPELTDSNDGKGSPAEISEARQALLIALENRSLMRALDSYGRDVDFACKNVLPVHGSSRSGKASLVKQSWINSAKKAKKVTPVALKGWEVSATTTT